MNFRTLCFSAIALASTLASAAEVSVQARAYSSSACAYYTTSLADFRFTYRGDLPYGSRVRVRYGFYGYNYSISPGSDYRDWLSLSEQEMTATAPYTWESTVEGAQVDSRGTSYYKDINFVFQLLLPNGDIRIEKGDSGLSYFSAPIPGRSCTPEGFVEPLITVVKT